MKFINLTPHAVVLNNGTVIPASGKIARVKTTYGEFNEHGIAEAVFEPIVEIPDPQPGVVYIVSGLVTQVIKRTDVVSPATSHPECVRDENMQIVSVPGFVRTKNIGDKTK